MSEIFALVEGVTERLFIRDILAPALAGKGVVLYARPIGDRRGLQGIRRYESAVRDILVALKEKPGRHCTTMLDYYGLPRDWPGLLKARKKRSILDKAREIEEALGKDVANRMGSSFSPSSFIPYIQMHEFEALLFTAPGITAQVLAPGDSALEAELTKIKNQASGPEKIDDGATTAPSKRIQSLVPSYDKTATAPVITFRIGLSAIRERCSHFNEWVTSLEALETRTPRGSRRKGK